MISGRSGFSSAYTADGVRVVFQWDLEYDDVANTVTVVATSSSDALSKANLIVTLQNGQERTFDLLTLNPTTGGTVINQGPVVFTNVHLKTGLSKNNVGVIEVRDDWTP